MWRQPGVCSLLAAAASPPHILSAWSLVGQRRGRPHGGGSANAPQAWAASSCAGQPAWRWLLVAVVSQHDQKGAGPRCENASLPTHQNTMSSGWGVENVLLGGE